MVRVATRTAADYSKAQKVLRRLRVVYGRYTLLAALRLAARSDPPAQDSADLLKTGAAVLPRTPRTRRRRLRRRRGGAKQAGGRDGPGPGARRAGRRPRH